MTNTPLPRHRLEGLVAPRSVVLVGASERNHYANLAMRAITRIGFDGAIHLVNRKGEAAYGRPATTTCTAIGEPVDAAYLCLPAEAVLAGARDAIDAGIRNLVIVSSGFAELGGAGAELEAQLLALCNAHDVRVLGPNCLGFRNNLAKVALGSIPWVDQEVEGSIALVSVSGSVASMAIQYGVLHGTGFSHSIATGNEMNVTAADLVDYLVDVPQVKAIALFLESIRDPETFINAATRAHAAKKPIIALKAGAAETTAAIAAAHTGAVVGDDKVFNALCDRLGIIRVPSIETMVNTAAMLAALGPIARPGVAFLSMSGGMSEIASDLAETTGVSFPQFAPETQTAMGSIISDLGQMHNPLDLTGAAVRDEEMWRRLTPVLARDPAIGLTLINWDVPNLAEPSMQNTLRIIGETLAAEPTPAMLIGNYSRQINEHGRAYMNKYGISFALPGLDHGLFATGKLAWWSAHVQRPLDLPEATPAPANPACPADERQSLAHLAAHGVPVIPQLVATSGAQAAAHAETIGGPVVLKVLSPDIAHKTEAGGVVLNLEGAAAVSAAYDRIMASVTAHAPTAHIEGILVSPMRGGGIEMLVGIARDPSWGPVLAVGLGGVWVEVLNDTALCLLPASPAEIRSKLAGLKAAKLLSGYRGAPATDLDQLAGVIAAIGSAALALGPDLAAFEVNPLHVNGDRIEALDALAVWNT